MKQKNRLKVWKQWLVGSLAILGLIALAGCSLFAGESIDGTWTSPSTAEKLKSQILSSIPSEGVFANPEYSFDDLLTDTEVKLTVADDKAKFEMTILVDREAAFAALNSEYDAALQKALTDQGLTYDSLDEAAKASFEQSRPSADSVYQVIDQIFEQMATTMNGTYNKEAGTVVATVFEGKVDRSASHIELTDINSALNTVSTKAGEKLVEPYKLKGEKLVLEEGEDRLTFEKAK